MKTNTDVAILSKTTCEKFIQNQLTGYHRKMCVCVNMYMSLSLCFSVYIIFLLYEKNEVGLKIINYISFLTMVI